MSWSQEEAIAAGGLVVAVAGAIGAGVLHAIKVSYRFGRTDQEQDELKERLAKLEARADGADAQQSAVKVLQGALEALKEQVIEMRQDLKNLMTGRMGAPRRGETPEG